MDNKQKKGISLIVLVITIIVLAILAATVVITLSDTNVIQQAADAVFKTDMAGYKERYSQWKANKLLENSTYNFSTLNVTSDDASFTEIFGSDVPTKYTSNLKIINGSVAYITEDTQQMEVLSALGIQTMEYSPDSWFNCTVKIFEPEEGEEIGMVPCFDTATGIIYGVNVPEGEHTLVIPTSIAGVKVNGISGVDQFSSDEYYTQIPDTITKVVLPSGIYLGDGAFGSTIREFVSQGAIKFQRSFMQPYSFGDAILNTNSKIKIANGSNCIYYDIYNLDFDVDGYANVAIDGDALAFNYDAALNAYVLPKSYAKLVFEYGEPSIDFYNLTEAVVYMPQEVYDQVGCGICVDNEDGTYTWHGDEQTCQINTNY